jgi:hypothetical protein
VDHKDVTGPVVASRRSPICSGIANRSGVSLFSGRFTIPGQADRSPVSAITPLQARPGDSSARFLPIAEAQVPKATKMPTVAPQLRPVAQGEVVGEGQPLQMSAPKGDVARVPGCRDTDATEMIGKR